MSTNFARVGVYWPVMSEQKDTQKRKKPSSVRHTRAIQRDRTKRPPTVPAPEEIKERLTELVHPHTLMVMDLFRQRGGRSRTLTLPVMMALVLEMLWQQVSGVTELARRINREAVLWASPRKVSQQALSQRLTTLPAVLFWEVLSAVLPTLQERWQARRRPLPPEIAWAEDHYTDAWMVDGSTLDSLVRKLGLLKDLPKAPLAGKITGLLHLGSRLPGHIWYQDYALTHDAKFWPQILEVLRAGSLLIMDSGYTNFAVFAQLTAAGVTFITRAKSNLSYTVERTLTYVPEVHDLVVWLGSGTTRQLARLVEVYFNGTWYRYLSNEVDPQRLPAPYLVALYRRRWRIEEAFGIVKRLLGLAYFWCGAQNAIELQLAATWLLYGVLVDLTDAVAEELLQPFDALSLEMVYRSIYYYIRAHERGETDDLIAYLAADAKGLGILKRKRKTSQPTVLGVMQSALDKAPQTLTCD
jgi:hypothetical protein